MQKRKPELGKYLLWYHFSKNASLRHYLPATRRMTKDSFLDFLEKYSMIYVKPSGGSRGVGIFKVTKRGGSVSVKKTTLKERTFKTPMEAFQHINHQREGKPYIVQKGLNLARINGRPFDIRVMLQRISPSARWQISGTVAKIAGKSSVVTNVALSGGTVQEVGPVLTTSFGWKKQAVERCIGEIKRISLVAANHFDSYQKYRELRMDVAVDNSGKVWLIEENTLPSHALFRKLSSNQSMYRTIQSRYGQYSRSLRASKPSKS
jgi:hypothetical protein